jgi:predicted dehydrogenase
MVNVALVGTGTIAEKYHLPILTSLPDVNIVALCDTNEKRLSRVAERFGVERKYTDLEHVFESLDVDIVDITTPGYTHYEIAKKALLSNANVLVEKPATLASAEIEDLEAESRKRNLKAGVCQAYRYSEPILRFQKCREEGKIGKIDRIITILRGSTLFGMAPWFWNENISGGILFELCIHAVDLQCYLMGPWEKVLEVNVTYNKAIDFITSISCSVKFKDGLGILDFKWHSSASFWHQYVSSSVADSIIKFYPDSFTLQRGEFSPLTECMEEVRRVWNFGYAAFRKRYYRTSERPHRIIIENFINSVKSGTEPLVSITDVIPTGRLLDEIWSRASAIKKAM